MERSTQEAVHLVALMDEIAFARHTPITRSIAAEALAKRAAAVSAAVGIEEDHEED
jgi:hypothetical protein